MFKRLIGHRGTVNSIYGIQNEFGIQIIELNEKIVSI